MVKTVRFLLQKERNTSQFNFVDLLTHYLNSDENIQSVIGKQSSSLVQSSVL